MAETRTLTYLPGMAMQRDLGKAAVKILASGASDPGGHIKTLKRIFSETATAPLRTAAHEAVARSMARATQNVVADISAKSQSKPRPGRLSGGLSRAVAHPSFAQGDRRGIRYLNRDVLRREAAHWQRLNFGTGAAQEAAYIAKPRVNGRQFLDVTIKPIAVGGGAVLRNPRIPEGWFLHGSKWVPKQAKYRGESTGRNFRVNPEGTEFRETSPIRGTHFVDAGLRTFELELPRAYDVMLRQFAAMSKGGKTQKNVKA